MKKTVLSLLLVLISASFSFARTYKTFYVLELKNSTYLVYEDNFNRDSIREENSNDKPSFRSIGDAINHVSSKGYEYIDSLEKRHYSMISMSAYIFLFKKDED